MDSRPGDEDGGEDDSDSDDESSTKAQYFGYIKQALYFVTEMERFAPPRKRPRTIIKNYRLVNLRSTTPEELYQRKVKMSVFHFPLLCKYLHIIIRYLFWLEYIHGPPVPGNLYTNICGSWCMLY